MPNAKRESLTALSDDEIVEYEQWKRVDVDGKKKMRIVKTSLSKEDFINLMTKEYSEILKHTERIALQYTAISDLKNYLPVGHAVVQMDFAENFQCQTMDEIQSAYWNATSVTLHPVVAYYRESEGGDLLHHNMIYISDLNHHNSTAVLAILRLLVPQLKVKIPVVNMIHYWTDSPYQYRNRFIFHVLANHQQLFGVHARWNYFEAGLGKGPCDGIGGLVKEELLRL